MKELSSKMKSDIQAHELIKRARFKKITASILGYPGAAMVGATVGSSLGGADINWIYGGIGIGLVIVAIPTFNSSNEKAKQAVDLYNSNLKKTSFYGYKPKLQIVSKGKGIGLVVNF